MSFVNYQKSLKKSFNFTFINEAFWTLGYVHAELIGKHFGVLIDPADVDAVSSSKVLPNYSGRKGQNEVEPKLFGERGMGKRKTRGFGIRIRIKSERRKVSGQVKWISKETGFIEVTSSNNKHETKTKAIL